MTIAPAATAMATGSWTPTAGYSSNTGPAGELDCRNDPEDFDGDRDHDGCPEE